MYCPMCGNKMSEMTDEEKKDWHIVSNEADHFLCVHCQLPRIFHHPFQGINSSAGDSWSVSFIK